MLDGRVRGSRYNVYLFIEDRARAVALGNGNISLGIRRALERVLP
jgi:hypothetical protein